MDLVDLDLFDQPATRQAVADACSVLRRPEPLVVDLAGGGRDLPPAARAALLAVPTVTVLVADPGAVDASVTDAFDVCLAPSHPDPPRPFVAAPLDPVRRAVADRPLVALALAALLRDPRPTTAAGLAAESATYALLLGSADFAAWRAARPRRERPATPDPVLVHDDGGTRTITLHRPEVRNALDRPMRDALVGALQGAAEDGAVRRVVLRGAGAGFCAGGDLDEFGSVGDPATAHAVRLTVHPGAWVDRCAAMTTALLHGPCIGAGIELPAFAGHVVATGDATFALPEVGLGLVPGAGGTVSLPRRIGRARTGWLALTGEAVGAATALRWGLVDEVVDALPPGPDPTG